MKNKTEGQQEKLQPKLKYKKINGKHCAILPHGSVVFESIDDKQRIQYEISRWNGEEAD